MELHTPYIFGNEIENLNKAIKKNQIAIGDFISTFEKEVSKFVKAKYAISTNSGTSALHIALKIAGVDFNTEVLVSTITFIAPINAILYNGGSPIFMDTNNTFNIDAVKTLDFIYNETYFKNGKTYNKKTNKKIIAIIVVHVFGNPAEINKLVKICKERNIKIIEDCAESLGSYFKNKKIEHTGSIGDYGCFSFNGNKIITSGSGGLITFKNKNDLLKARLYINQYKNDNLKFIHNDLGYNFRMTNISAAIGMAQLKHIKKILTHKLKIHNYYKFKINSYDYSILNTPNNCISNNWLNILCINNKKISTNKIIKKLLKNKINVRYIWYPNHLQKIMKKFQCYKMTNYKKYKQCICLPSGYNISKKNINYITKVLHE